MVQFNLKKREVSFKIVYYGPALVGKTTTLQALFSQTNESARGRLMTLEARDDRTLLFDTLPMPLPSDSGYQLSLKLYTVPGHSLHDVAHRMILRGVDAVVFVASSDPTVQSSNGTIWTQYLKNLEASERDIRSVPTVIQFNKQDVSGALTAEQIRAVQDYSGIPTYSTSALRGEGCSEALEGLLAILWQHLSAKQHLQDRLGLSNAQFQNHIRSIFSGAVEDSA